jgi:predicted transcriptional regulator
LACADRQADGIAALCPPARCPSIRALAKALGRDYSNVHADVQALTGAGLLDASSGGVRADYDAIETRIAI